MKFLIVVLLISLAALLGGGCGEDGGYGENGEAQPPPADRFLPPLPERRTDDDAETGELEASLDEGGLPHVETRRRLILDEEGFFLGEIMVVTFEPDTAGAELFLEHWFGESDGEPVEAAGVQMERIPTQAQDALVWTGPEFVVVFQRGQEVGHDWLRELAEVTVRAID